MKSTTLVTRSFFGLTVLIGACVSAPQPVVQSTTQEGRFCDGPPPGVGATDDAESPVVIGVGVGESRMLNMSRIQAMARARIDLTTKVVSDFNGRINDAANTVGADPLLARILVETQTETVETFQGMLTGLSNTANDVCETEEGVWRFTARMEADRAALLTSMINGVENVVLSLRDNPEVEFSEEDFQQSLQEIDNVAQEALRNVRIRN